MIAGNGVIAKSGWKDCSTCQKFDPEIFKCEIYGYGTLPDKVYFSCNNHVKR